MISFKSSENIQKKEGWPDRSVSDNQSSSAILNELAMKDRKSYCNFMLQQKSNTITDINPNEVLIILLRIYESKPIIFSVFSEYLVLVKLVFSGKPRLHPFPASKLISF